MGCSILDRDLMSHMKCDRITARVKRAVDDADRAISAAGDEDPLLIRRNGQAPGGIAQDRCFSAITGTVC